MAQGSTTISFEVPIDTLTSLGFYGVAAIYIIFTAIMYYHWNAYSIDKNVTRSSVSQIHDGKRVKDIRHARPGDILVFKGRNPRNNRPGHVGLVHHWGNDTLYFIHSSVTKGVCIDHMYDPYYSKRFLQVRNVIGD